MDSNSHRKSRLYLKALLGFLLIKKKKKPQGWAKTPYLQTDPKCSPNSLYMVTEMDCFTYPTNVQATVSHFSTVRRENRLADLGLDQKEIFLNSYTGLLKTHTHNNTTTTQPLNMGCCHEPQT